MKEQEHEQELERLMEQVRRIQIDNAYVMNQIMKQAQRMQSAINDVADIAFYMRLEVANEVAKAKYEAAKAKEVVA